MQRCDARRRHLAHSFSVHRYKHDLGTIASVEADMKKWQQSNDADARAMEERCRRWLRRLRGLPAGDTFPFPVSLLRVIT